MRMRLNSVTEPDHRTLYGKYGYRLDIARFSATTLFSKGFDSGHDGGGGLCPSGVFHGASKYGINWGRFVACDSTGSGRGVYGGRSQLNGLFLGVGGCRPPGGHSYRLVARQRGGAQRCRDWDCFFGNVCVGCHGYFRLISARRRAFGHERFFVRQCVRDWAGRPSFGSLGTCF